MRYPSIDSLLEVVKSKYELVLIAAKRGREIEAGDLPLIPEPKCKKAVGIALEEIVAGMLNQS